MIVKHAGAPVLICLNLQCAYIDARDPCYAPRSVEALVHASACLSWARRQSIKVWHVHTRDEGARGAPISGFEPRPDEPLFFKQSWSLFDSAELARAHPPLRDAFVIGFTAAKDCVAAAIDAERAGARLIFVTDAIASSSLADQPAELVDNVMAALLAEWAVGVNTAELLRREPRRAAYGERALT